MHWIRSDIPSIAQERQRASSARAIPMEKSAASDDLRLFATTFAAGFLFVTLFIA